MNANLLNERIAMLQTDVAALFAERDALKAALQRMTAIGAALVCNPAAPKTEREALAVEFSAAMNQARAALSIPAASNEPAKVDKCPTCPHCLRPATFVDDRGFRDGSGKVYTCRNRDCFEFSKYFYLP